MQRGQGVTFDAVDKGEAIIIEDVSQEKNIHYFRGEQSEIESSEIEGGAFMALPIRDPRNQKVRLFFFNSIFPSLLKTQGFLIHTFFRLLQ